jgi:hypothetical protein
MQQYQWQWQLTDINRSASLPATPSPARQLPVSMLFESAQHVQAELF